LTITHLKFLQIDFEERKVGWSYTVPSCIIDTFKCKIEQPENESWQYTTSANHFTVKYEIGISFGLRHICWISGPWKGAASDPTIAIASGLKAQLGPNECAMTDKIYRGDRMSFLCPISGHCYVLSDDQKAFNFLLYSARQNVERVIQRVRVFSVWEGVWKKELWLQQLCVVVSCQLVNFVLLFEPLDK
jgi:hypothetical protein